MEETQIKKIIGFSIIVLLLIISLVLYNRKNTSQTSSQKRQNIPTRVLQNTPSSGPYSNILVSDGDGNLNSIGFPIGTIIMWYPPSSTDTTIPNGWAVCNGTTVNGYTTPDLRSRFIAGASYYNRGGDITNNTGSPPDITLTHYPVGTGSSDGTYIIKNDDLPVHQHAYNDVFLVLPKTVTVDGEGADVSFIQSAQGVLNTPAILEGTGVDANGKAYSATKLTGQNIGSAVSTAAEDTAKPMASSPNNPIPIVPAYYALIYLMKIM